MYNWIYAVFRHIENFDRSVFGLYENERTIFSVDIRMKQMENMSNAYKSEATKNPRQ